MVPASESVEKEVHTIVEPSINPLRAIRRKEMELRKTSQRQREELSRIHMEERGREDEFSVFLHTAVEMDATKRIAQQSLEAVNRSTYFIPSLVDLCAREIASHFHGMFSYDMILHQVGVLGADVDDVDDVMD
jgi:hypothetical protein